MRAQTKHVRTLAALCNAEKANMPKEVATAAGSRKHSVMQQRRRSQYAPAKERPGLLKRKDSIINKMRFRDQIVTPAHAAASFKRLAQPKTPKASTKKRSSTRRCHQSSVLRSAQPRSGSAGSLCPTKSTPAMLKGSRSHVRDW